MKNNPGTCLRLYFLLFLNGCFDCEFIGLNGELRSKVIKLTFRWNAKHIFALLHSIELCKEVQRKFRIFRKMAT